MASPAASARSPLPSAATAACRPQRTVARTRAAVHSSCSRGGQAGQYRTAKSASASASRAATAARLASPCTTGPAAADSVTQRSPTPSSTPSLRSMRRRRSRTHGSARSAKSSVCCAASQWCVTIASGSGIRKRRASGW